MRKKKSLRTKLVSFTMISIVLPLLAVGSLAVNKASTALADISRGQAEKLSGTLAASVNNVLLLEMSLVSELSVDEVVAETANDRVAKGEAGPQTAIKALSDHLAVVFKKIDPHYESLFFADASGTILADSANGAYQGIRIADRAYFKAAKAGRINVGDAVLSRATGNAVFPVCAPVLTPAGDFAGVVAIIIQFGRITESISAISVGKTGYACMVDSRGFFLAHPRKDLVLEQNISRMAGMEALWSAMSSGESGVMDSVFNGIPSVSGYAPITTTGWAIAVTQNKEDFLAAPRSIRNTTLWVGLLAMGVAIIAVLCFASSLTLPIERIVQGITEGAEQVTAASGQVSASSQMLADGASEQAISIEETAGALSEMVTMTRQNTDNVDEANLLMEEAHEIVVKASREIEDLTRSMGEISDASEEIQKIVKAINEIAFQTNLLALNAAVEAARAGDAGAGFAVVADEVRNLAIRAAEAARETSVLIEGTSRRVQGGVVLLGNTRDAFDGIGQSADKVGRLIGKIATASRAQDQSAGKVHLAVNEMDKIVQTNAATAEESASTSEEMNAQSEQMKLVVEDLVTLVEGSASQLKQGITGPAR